MPNIKRLEAICKEYDLPVFENPKDNLLMIFEAAEPTKEEKWEALDIYEEWLLYLHRED